ncbi:MAG: hypothetical protein IT410_00490 [Candidatus Doudnabacteria bacterium]|nr:hypothetical protein [Candidatus Doudnabacteria bacterium]
MNFPEIFKLRYSRAALLVGAVFVLIFGAFVRPVQAITTTPRIEINANPGESVTEILKISNEEKQSRTFYTNLQNFESQDESGSPRFTNRKEDLAVWVEVAEVITIGPGETLEIPIKVNVPENADPGGHFAAMFLETTPPNADQGGQVGISSKLGTLLLLRVNGDFVQNANILEFATKDKKRFFTALPVYFYYRFQNVGEDHLRPVGDVLITNMFGRTTKILPANPVDGSILPKSIRRFETVWASSWGDLQQGADPEIPSPAGPGFWDQVKYQWHNFAFGKYKASLSVVFGTKELKSDSKSYTFYVIPWQLITVVISGLIVAFIVGRFSIKRYNRYIINQATNNKSPKKRRTKKDKEPL